MTALRTPDRWEPIVDVVSESMREPIKEAVKEAIREAEAESAGSSGTGGLSGSVRLFGLGMAIGYALRSRSSTEEFDPLEETKQFAEAVQAEEDEPSGDENFEEVDITEGRDRSESGGNRNFLSRVLLVLGIAVIGYALKSRSGLVMDVADDATDQVEETVEQASEVSEPPATSTDGMGADEGSDEDDESA